jgi:hypothetical protein
MTRAGPGLSRCRAVCAGGAGAAADLWHARQGWFG